MPRRRYELSRSSTGALPTCYRNSSSRVSRLVRSAVEKPMGKFGIRSKIVPYSVRAHPDRQT